VYALDARTVLRRYRRAPGGAVIRLDLHPENVLLHGTGVLVIDWANARDGHWADDVARAEHARPRL